MDVIGFLCVSLGSSTVQLHDSLGSTRACAYSEAGFSSQNGDRAWVYYRRAAFWFGKTTNCKGYSLKMFPVYGGKCLSRKAVHSWVVNVSLMTKGLKRKCGTVYRLLCCGFRSTGIAMGQLYQCWWRICREIHFFSPGSNITCFISLYDIFTDSPCYNPTIRLHTVLASDCHKQPTKNNPAPWSLFLC
jgi:hypothetical protein